MREAIRDALRAREAIVVDIHNELGHVVRSWYDSTFEFVRLCWLYAIDNPTVEQQNQINTLQARFRDVGNIAERLYAIGAMPVRLLRLIFVMNYPRNGLVFNNIRTSGDTNLLQSNSHLFRFESICLGNQMNHSVVIIRTADFNGDGRADLLKLVPSSYSGDGDCGAGISSVLFSLSLTGIVFSSAFCLTAISNINSDRMTLNFFDTNNDVADDIVFQLGSYGSSSCSTGTGGVYVSYRNGSFSAPLCFNFNAHKDYVTIIPMDIDGDGLLDLLTQINPSYASNTQCSTSVNSGGIYMSNANGTFSFNTCTTFNVNPVISTIHKGFFNEDSAHDLIVQYSLSSSNLARSPGQAAVYVSLQNGQFNLSSCFGYFPTESVKMIMADVNGDGFTDIVTQVNTGVSGSSNAACISNGGGAVFLSNGNGTFATAVCLTFSVAQNDVNLFLADVNGDGRTDAIAQVSSTYTTNSTCAVGQSAIFIAQYNATFAPPACIASNILKSTIKLTMADFHGTGASEMFFQLDSTNTNNECLSGRGGAYSLSTSLLYWYFPL